MLWVGVVLMRAAHDRAVHYYGDSVVEDAFAKDHREKIVVRVDLLENRKYRHRICRRNQRTERPTLLQAKLLSRI